MSELIGVIAEENRERQEYEDAGGEKPRIRKMSTDDATKALRWIHEQDELNSATYLSRGRSGDDLSSSLATPADFNSMTTPSVVHLNQAGNAGASTGGGGYPYGSGQRPGVFSGLFSGGGGGDEEGTGAGDQDAITARTAGTETERNALALQEQSMAGPPANNNAKNKGMPNSTRALTISNQIQNNPASSSPGGGSYYWLEYLIFPALAIAIQIVFGRDFAFPDGLEESTGRACRSALDPINTSMCGLENSLQEAQDQVRFLTAFVLGGFVLMTVSLWKQRRTSYEGLCSAVRNINIQLASLLPLPVDVTESESRRVIHARKTLSRWSLLGYELAVLKARGVMDEESQAIPHLKQLGLLVEGEWDAMIPGDRHTTVWLWMQTKAVKLGHEKIIDPTIHVQTICKAIDMMRDKSNDLMTSISKDQPMPYAAIVGALVNYTLLLLSVWKGVDWSIWLYEDGPDIYGTPKMYIDILILLATSLLFGTLYDLTHILYNPFGDREMDIPHLAVGGGIRRTARAFAKGSNLPPSMEPNSTDDPACINEVEKDSGYYMKAPVDNMHARRHGNLLGGMAQKMVSG